MEGNSWIPNPVPRKAWVAALGAGAAWYGKRVAQVYAPEIVRDVFVKAYYCRYGSSPAQKVWVHLVVVPVTVPSVVPYVNWAAGAVLGVGVVMAGNYLDQKMKECEQAIDD